MLHAAANFRRRRDGVAEREKIVRVALWEKAGRPWVGERIAGMQLVICQEGAAVDVDDPPARGLLSWRFTALRSMETGAGQKQAEEEPGPEPAGGDRQSAKTAVAKMPGPSHAAANNVLERIVELLPAAPRVKICEAGSRDAQVALVTKALLHDSTLDTELAALDVLPLVASIAVGEGPSIDYFEVVDAVMAAAKPEPKKKSGGSGGKAPGSPKAHDPPARHRLKPPPSRSTPSFFPPTRSSPATTSTRLRSPSWPARSSSTARCSPCWSGRNPRRVARSLACRATRPTARMRSATASGAGGRPRSPACG